MDCIVLHDLKRCVEKSCLVHIQLEKMEVSWAKLLSGTVDNYRVTEDLELFSFFNLEPQHSKEW